MHAAENMRVYKRDFFSITLDYAYVSYEDGRKQYNTSSAVTSNLSTGGVGIFTSIPLSAGMEIEITTDRIEGCPCKAEVRWAACLTHNLYRAGVKFH